MINRPKAIIFDFDGVFVDSWGFHLNALKKTLKQMGLEFSEDEINEAFYSYALYDGAERLLKPHNLHDRIDKLIKIKKSFDKSFAESVPTYEPTIEFVKKYSDKYRMCIASGARQILIQPYLELNELKKYFEFVVTSDEVERPKPNPDIYLLAQKKLNLPKEEVVIVEDSPLGVKGAKRSGIHTIAVTQTARPEELHEADAIIRDCSELEEELDS